MVIQNIGPAVEAKFLNRAAFVFASVVWATFSTLSHAGVAQIDWANLVDPSVQQFDDPYAALEDDELYVLSKIVRLRSSLESGSPSAENTTKLKDAEARFAETGIDVDWLLDQRWVVADCKARVIKRIFEDYAQGETPRNIAKKIERRGCCSTPRCQMESIYIKW